MRLKHGVGITSQALYMSVRTCDASAVPPASVASDCPAAGWQALVYGLSSQPLAARQLGALLKL